MVPGETETQRKRAIERERDTEGDRDTERSRWSANELKTGLGNHGRPPCLKAPSILLSYMTFSKLLNLKAYSCFLLVFNSY